MKPLLLQFLKSRFRFLLAGASVLALMMIGLTVWSQGDPLVSEVQKIEKEAESLFIDRNDPNAPELRVHDFSSQEVQEFIASLGKLKETIETQIGKKKPEIQIDVARRYLDLLKYLHQNYFASLHSTHIETVIPSEFLPNKYENLNLVVPVEVGDGIMFDLSTDDLRSNLWHRELEPGTGVFDRVELGLTPHDWFSLEGFALLSLKQLHRQDKKMVRSLYSKLVIAQTLYQRASQLYNLSALTNETNAPSPAMPFDCGQHTISLRATPNSHFKSFFDFRSKHEAYQAYKIMLDRKTMGADQQPLISRILTPVRQNPIADGRDAGGLTRRFFEQSYLYGILVSLYSDRQTAMDTLYNQSIPKNFTNSRNKFWNETKKTNGLFTLAHYPSDDWDLKKVARRIAENAYLYEIEFLAALLIENGENHKEYIVELSDPLSPNGSTNVWAQGRAEFVKKATGLAQTLLGTKKSGWINRMQPQIEKALQEGIPLSLRMRRETSLDALQESLQPTVEAAAKSKLILRKLYDRYQKNEDTWTKDKILLPVNYSDFQTGSTVFQVIVDQFSNNRVWPNFKTWFQNNAVDEPLRKAVYDSRNDQLAMIPYYSKSAGPNYPAQLLLMYEKKIAAFAGSPFPSELRNLALKILGDRNSRVLLVKFFEKISETFTEKRKKNKNPENVATDLPDTIREVLSTYFEDPSWDDLPAGAENPAQSRCYFMESLALLGLSDWVPTNTRILNTYSLSEEINQNEPYAIWKVTSFTGRLNYLKSVDPDANTIASRLIQTVLDHKILNEIILKTTLETESVLNLVKKEKINIDRFGNDISITLLDELIDQVNGLRFAGKGWDSELTKEKISAASRAAVAELPEQLRQGCIASLLPARNFDNEDFLREINLAGSIADTWRLNEGQKSFQTLFRLSTSSRNKTIGLDEEGEDGSEGAFFKAEKELEKATRTVKEKIREDYLEPRIHQSLYLVAILATIDLAPVASSAVKGLRFWTTTTGAVRYALATAGTVGGRQLAQKGLFNWIRNRGFSKWYMIYLDGIFVWDWINIMLTSRYDLPKELQEAALGYHLGGTEAETVREISGKLKEARTTFAISTAVNIPVFYSIYHRLATLIRHPAGDAFRTLVLHGGEPAVGMAVDMAHADLKSPLKTAAENVFDLKTPVFNPGVGEKEIVDLTARATANAFPWFKLGTEIIPQTKEILLGETRRLTSEIEALLSYGNDLDRAVTPPNAPTGINVDLVVNQLANHGKYKEILADINKLPPESWPQIWKKAYGLDLAKFQTSVSTGSARQNDLFALIVVKNEYLLLLENRLKYLSFLEQDLAGFQNEILIKQKRTLGTPDISLQSEWGAEFFTRHFNTQGCAPLFFETFQSGYSDALRRTGWPGDLGTRLPVGTYKAINEVGEAYRTLMSNLIK